MYLPWLTRNKQWLHFQTHLPDRKPCTRRPGASAGAAPARSSRARTLVARGRPRRTAAPRRFCSA